MHILDAVRLPSVGNINASHFLSIYSFSYFIVAPVHSFDFPKNNLSCPGDIKVAAGSGATFKKSTDSIYANLEGLKGFANESCIQSVKKFSCLGIARCERERQYVDIPAAISACEAARRVCPKLIKDIMLDCQANKVLFESVSLNVTKYQCKNMKDTTGTCPDVKYKVSSVTVFQFSCHHCCTITR